MIAWTRVETIGRCLPLESGKFCTLFHTIAGMIQYKHASVAAFEGYAGSSRSGFRAEVEAQRAFGELDDILAYFDEHRAGTPLHGPAASRIANTMDAAVNELGLLPQ